MFNGAKISPLKFHNLNVDQIIVHIRWHLGNKHRHIQTSAIPIDIAKMPKFERAKSIWPMFGSVEKRQHYVEKDLSHRVFFLVFLPMLI